MTRVLIHAGHATPGCDGARVVNPRQLPPTRRAAHDQLMRTLQPGDRVIALRNLGLLGEVSKGTLGTVVDRSNGILFFPTVYEVRFDDGKRATALTDKDIS